MASSENSKRDIEAVKQQGGIGNLVIADGDDHVSLVSADSASYRQNLDTITEISTETVDQLDQQRSG